MLRPMSPFLAVGFGLYVLNMLVGLAAQFRLGHFGIWHHGLYLVVFICAVLAMVFAREWWLLLTVGCLALFPKARPRTWLHPTLGMVGLVGYLLAVRG
ncbi:MAG: hypothetical protein KatS3mg072_2750 [Meiothermus sp.]|nr:MAG: hypothetical protein KatS3mg072_2750 [Meiothermus sp.]